MVNSKTLVEVENTEGGKIQFDISSEETDISLRTNDGEGGKISTVKTTDLIKLLPFLLAFK